MRGGLLREVRSWPLSASPRAASGGPRNTAILAALNGLGRASYEQPCSTPGPEALAAWPTRGDTEVADCAPGAGLLSATRHRRVCLVSLQSAGSPPEGPKGKGLITWKPLSGFPSSFPRRWFVGGPRGDDAGAPHLATALELCPTSNVLGANESEIELGRIIVEWSLACGPTMQVPSLVIRPLDPTRVTTGPNAYTKSSQFSVSSTERLSHISTVFPRAVTATAALRQLLADIAALRFARALGTLVTAPSGRLRRWRT